MDPELKWDIPNNRLICQICCEWTLFVDLYVDSHGDTWDICFECGFIEEWAQETPHKSECQCLACGEKP